MANFIKTFFLIVQVQPVGGPGHIMVHSSQPTLVRSQNVQVCQTLLGLSLLFVSRSIVLSKYVLYNFCSMKHVRVILNQLQHENE